MAGQFGEGGVRVRVNKVCHVEGVQSVHTDEQDVVNIGRIGGRAKGHAGQHAEGDLFQNHEIFLREFLFAA